MVNHTLTIRRQIANCRRIECVEHFVRLALKGLKQLWLQRKM